jgi:hypothetical protein
LLYTAGHKHNDMPGIPPQTTQDGREALAALERYQLHVRQLVTQRLDAELYHAVSLDIQEVRRCCHAISPLSADWVALLIAHAELSQALWRSGQPDAPSPQERQRLLANALQCVRRLQQRCMELGGPPAGNH